MTYREVYESGVNTLKENDCKEAVLDARLLLEYVCGTNRNDLLVHGDREVPSEAVKQYREYICRRAGGEPVQYITGEQDFMGLTSFKGADVTLDDVRIAKNSLTENELSATHTYARSLKF